jgi:alanine dehydrogenase
VALLPSACAELVRHGHEVLVERGAGRLSGYDDEGFEHSGARIVDTAEALYAAAELIVKVKEPLGPELDFLRADHLLFCFLHLAANRDLGARLRAIGLTAVAFETVQVDGRLPLLAPMSEVAGRIATQVGMHLLHQPQGGSGVLLGGLAGTPRGHVVVIGAGTAGGAAAALAAQIGAEVTVLDRNPEALHRMRTLGANVTTLYASHQEIEAAVSGADLLVGAVLVAGRRAPQVVSREMVARMRRGSVIVDISVDQGGCVQTTRPMTYGDPIYREQGVLHFTVTNMPGAVPRSATQVLSANLIPYVLRLAEPGWEQDKALAAGINVRAGAYVNPIISAELK